MKTEDIAILIEGLVRALNGGLKDKERKELCDLVDLLRRKPDLPLSEFLDLLKTVQGEGDRKIQVLVNTIRGISSASDEECRSLKKDLAGMGLGELRRLSESLGISPGKTKKENLEKIGQIAGFSAGNGLNGHGALESKIQEAMSAYLEIKNNLRSSSIEEIRQKFSIIAEQPKQVLVGLLEKMGYSTGGTKSELSSKLLGSLTSIKVSIEQNKQIERLKI